LKILVTIYFDFIKYKLSITLIRKNYINYQDQWIIIQPRCHVTKLVRYFMLHYIYSKQVEEIHKGFLESKLMKREEHLGPVCLLESSFFLESEFWGKWIPGKYFPIFGSVMKNKLENTFQCLVVSWKMSWKITY
jgi:hypothetical protein